MRSQIPTGSKQLPTVAGTKCVAQEHLTLTLGVPASTPCREPSIADSPRFLKIKTHTPKRKLEQGVRCAEPPWQSNNAYRSSARRKMKQTKPTFIPETTYRYRPPNTMENQDRDTQHGAKKTANNAFKTGASAWEHNNGTHTPSRIVRRRHERGRACMPRINTLLESMAHTHSRTAKTAALALSVSKIVSTIIMSDPPSTKPLVWSLYATTSSSKVTFRKDGSSTSCGITPQERR